LAVSSGDRPYLVFLTVGTCAWTFFQRAAYWGFRGLPIHRRIIGRSQVPWLAVIVAGFVPATVESLLYALTAIITVLYYLVTQGTFYLTIGSATTASLLGLVMLALYAVAWGTLTAPIVSKVPDLRFTLRYLLGFAYY